MGKIVREHKTMANSQKTNSNKLNAQLLDSSHISVNDVGKVIDSQAIQELMNYFYKVTNIGIGIIDLKGNILVATGWQDVCTKFHRVNPETCRHCIESDTVLSENGEEGKYILYKCKNHMWDMSTPIKVRGIHIANLFLGQFFFENEELDYEFFNSQAEQCGFDKKEYMDALQRVPRWSREKVNNVMEFYSRFAGMIANITYSNEELERNAKERTYELIIKNKELAEEIADRKRAKSTLRESEEKFRSLVETTSDLIWEVDGECILHLCKPDC
jgi:ligand-binding sensor protein